MSNITIKSEGRFINTQVSIDERVIEPGNLTKVTIFYEPQIQQVALEVCFVNEDGRLERWSGVNADDTLNFSLLATEQETGTTYRVRATESVFTAGLVVGENLYEIFAGSPKVLEIAADGWALQGNKYFDMMPKKEGV
jgi:hypothetical protein